MTIFTLMLSCCHFSCLIWYSLEKCKDRKVPLESRERKRSWNPLARGKKSERRNLKHIENDGKVLLFARLETVKKSKSCANDVFCAIHFIHSPFFAPRFFARSFWAAYLVSEEHTSKRACMRIKWEIRMITITNSVLHLLDMMWTLLVCMDVMANWNGTCKRVATQIFLLQLHHHHNSLVSMEKVNRVKFRTQIKIQLIRNLNGLTDENVKNDNDQKVKRIENDRARVEISSASH